MTDTTDERLDLSILASVAPGPEVDEKPDTVRDDSGTTPGKPADEEKPRRRTPRTKPREGVTSRTFVPDDEPLIPDYKPGMFVKPLTDAYMTIGAMVLPFNQPVGTAFLQNAEECAKALDNAAKVDKKFRAWLLAAVSTSVWMPVLIAHMPILTATVVTVLPDAKRRLDGVQLPEQQPGETINPVSNGYAR
jgi:hypothetical protein